MSQVTIADAGWAAIMADPRLAAVRRKLSFHEIRMIVDHSRASVAVPTLRAAFRTTESGEGSYKMVFSFPSMVDLHAADDEWRAILVTANREEAVEALEMQDGGERG